ncbi:PC4-domain-containing protein [Durotheca rogersii]|uniref:PC4-domain-containing protein n=1 Tax=Durotheca rogersii TaxID=419775 RepID=UPI00222047F2|nr:PC4-domain-containing protein [Durotheca rogersii]KAI5860185.1 PC4-domain-containing protein [Durotheca rogersii]
MGRTKGLKRSRRDDDEGVESDAEVKSTSKSSKKVKKGDAESGKDDDGNPFWALGGTRRATISNFKGKVFVNLREYYSDSSSGSLKPGKKGITLTIEQYHKLLEAIPSINAELRDKGHDVPGAPDAPAASTSDAPAKATADKEKKAKKANIETTSDEDEDEGAE